MTATFTNGPADGLTLPITRAPIFLRLTVTWDNRWTALSGPDDVPGRNVRCWGYERVSLGIDRDEDNAGKPAPPTPYRLMSPQPTSPQKFSTELWRTMCWMRGQERVLGVSVHKGVRG